MHVFSLILSLHCGHFEDGCRVGKSPVSLVFYVLIQFVCSSLMWPGLGHQWQASVASYPPMGRPVNICDDDTNKALLADEDEGDLLTPDIPETRD